MKRIATIAIGIVACAMACAPAAAQDADDAPVRIRADAPLSPMQRERLQRYADRGVDSLRRYIWITRGIYNYRLSDLV